MNLAKVMIGVLAFFVFSSCTITRPQEKLRTVTVDGSGSVEVIPDGATIDFVVVTSGWSAKQIIADSEIIAKRFIQSVLNAGINEDDIVMGEPNITTSGQSMEARRGVTVTTTNLNLVGNIIDLKTASIRLAKVQYFVQDMASEVRRARTQAIQLAQDAAGLYAGAGGCKPQSVIRIDTDSVKDEYTTQGKIKIQANVKVTYDLQ